MVATAIIENKRNEKARQTSAGLFVPNFLQIPSSPGQRDGGKITASAAG
ncbi:hypothetical protein CLV36_11834 [Laceyella sediminis]|uniref:Uncharacterized protein n=1 Tax=Laceyella sediminis TaxID=573074 RepID=A0ABX5EN05_9BACL|nr:hypothetical protein CLV36_11834 [Laceyella sediminis]